MASTNMSTKHLKVIFGGKLHDIDADVLIESLINYSAITQEVSSFLSSGSKVNIKIKAIQKGSFELLLDIVAKAGNSLFAPQNIAYASGIVTVVGGLYKFRQWIAKNGEPEIIEKKGDDSIKIKNNKGEIIINNNVFHIYQSSDKVREGLKRTFVKLKDAEEIENFEIRDEDNAERIFQVSKEDFDLMASGIGEPAKRKQTEIKTDQELFVFKVVFRENYKWEFFYNGNRIYASILDASFIEKVGKGEIAFRSGDRIVADLEIVQVFNEAANVFVNDEYFITKVKQHIPRSVSVQNSLKFVDNSNED